MGSADLAGSRLGIHHFAYLRSIAQGLPLVEAARRYLAIDHGAEAVTAHRLVVDRVRAVARRRGDGRWRLVGIEIRDRGAAERSSPPSLEEWSQAEGLDGWSQAELEELYVERFGGTTSDRRSVRNARLRVQRLALLRDLEAVAAERAAPTDLIDGWLEPRIAAQLRQAGDLLMGDLQRRIARGGRWWRGLSAVGPRKAERLARHVAMVFGETAVVPLPPWQLTRTAQESSALAGCAAPGLATGIEASNDREAVRSWIAARSGSACTSKLYEREAERFMLWCVVERGKAMSSVGAEDCRAYMDFLVDVPERWVSRNRAGRLQPGWAPFKGSLSVASQRVALAALHSLFGWLVQARYLGANPWVLVNRKLGDDAGLDDEDVTSRAFTPAAWSAMLERLETEKATLATARLRWLCAFVECTGLRAAELLKATFGHLKPSADGWSLRVHGKGRRNRSVPVPERAMQATRQYLEARGLRLEHAPGHTPLLASLVDPMAPITYSALNETFTRFVRRAVAHSSLPAAEADRAIRGSTHWLRHTHATRSAERAVPPDVLQENMGQSDPRTTARYYRAQLQRRHREAERAFPVGADTAF
jgi:integrase